MDDKKKFKPEEDQKVKMYRVTITEEVEATDIDAARKALTEKMRLAAFKKSRIDDAVTRVVRKKYSSRASRLDEARSLIGQARDTVQELKDEVQEWHDNLPENFQNGDKGQVLDECAQNLEQVESSLDEAESNCESVEFPGMFD